MNKPQLSKICCTALLAGLLTAIAAVAQASLETEDVILGKNWQTVLVKQVANGEETVRGRLLFTTDTEATGIAFRCEKGKMFALVSTRPVDFKRMLGLRFRGSEDWQVSFTLNGGDPQNEEWVQMYRGRIFMVKELRTTRQLFELANSQGSFDFTRKYGKPVTVALPAPEPEVFDKFLQDCQLQDKYLPDLQAASKAASPPQA